MKKHFYSNIVELESLFYELDLLELEDYQKHELSNLIDSNLHHTILDIILSELSDDDKKLFLKHLNENDHDKVWEHLKFKVDNIEEKIKKAAEQLKMDLRKDIKEAKYLHKKTK